jgi:CheY-like chemotaxis protein
MNRPNVLIVDDSTLQRRAIAALLAPYDCDLREAGNGAEALVQLQQAPADLVLLDYNMPVMDGMEFLRTLREDPGRALTPVIMLTANAAPQTLAAAARLRVRDYLVKPVDGALLIGKLSRWISLRLRAASAPVVESP